MDVKLPQYFNRNEVGPDVYDASFQEESYGPSLRDYIEIIIRRKYLILACFLITLIGVGAYTFTRIPLYQSSATVQIGGIQGINVKETASSTPESATEALKNETSILKSRGLAEEYVRRLNVSGEQTEELTPNLLDKIRFNGKNGPVKESQDIKELLTDTDMTLSPKLAGLAGTLSSMVTVAPVKGSTNFLNVSVRAETPELANTILKNYLRLYLEKNLELRRSESLEAANWLKDELEKSEAKLRESQSNLFIFALENGIVIDEDEKGKGFGFKSLTRSFEGLQQSKQTQTRMQALKVHQGKMLPDGVNNEYIGRLKQDVALMESEYTQMQGVYSANYPKMQIMRQKIKFLQDKIVSMEKQVVESSLEVAQTEQGLLEESFEKAKGETDRIKALEANFTLLRKEVETNTEFHKILLKEYKQVDIKARTMMNNARIIDPPTMPTSPAWPRKGLFMLIGALGGLFLGVGLAIVLDKLDSTIQSPVNIERQFGVRRLGLVPDVGKTLALKSTPDDKSALALSAYHNPRTPLSDSIKNIHTSIYFSHLEHPAQKIMITSAAPGEGKSTISVSMATILTNKGDRRVIIVDCDLRRPNIHNLLGNRDNSVGLSNHILDSSIDLAHVIRAHQIKGLYYITSGPIVDDPVTMLASDRMSGLVEQLSEEFDYVVLDAPPTLGFPDASIVSSYSDGVIFVVKHASSSKHEVDEALNTLRSTNGTRILGVVMNQFNAPSAYGYKYRYGGYYYRNQKYYSHKQPEA